MRVDSPRPQLVTLDQCAAMVHLSRRSLFRYRSRGMPLPFRPGYHGRPGLYDWSEMRPWLEKTFGIPLPEVHPSYAA